MLRINLILLMALLHASYFACTIPFSGEKYNTLIRIEQVENIEYGNDRAYRVSFPVEVEGLKFEAPSITIFSINDKTTKSLDSYIVTPLEVKETDGKLSGIIIVSDKSKLTFEINVGWWGSVGNCPILAARSFSDK